MTTELTGKRRIEMEKKKMTVKSARRWLKRNAWNIHKDQRGAFWRRMALCKRIVGEVLYRKFELISE